ADRWGSISLSDAAGFGRAFPIRPSQRRGRLRALGLDHRRCAGGGLRQGGQALGAGLSGRAGGGKGGDGGRWEAIRPAPAAAEGKAARFFVFGPQDRAAAGRRGGGAGVGQGRRRSLRELPGGGDRDRRRAVTTGAGAVFSTLSRQDS